jgi:hypothetical protein
MISQTWGGETNFSVIACRGLPAALAILTQIQKIQMTTPG